MPLCAMRRTSSTDGSGKRVCENQPDACTAVPVGVRALAPQMSRVMGAASVGAKEAEGMHAWSSIFENSLSPSHCSQLPLAAAASGSAGGALPQPSA